MVAEPGHARQHFGAAPVRTAIIDGDPRFVAKDVADLLGYVNPQERSGPTARG